MHTFNGDCKACKESSDWESIKGELKEFNRGIFWNSVAFMIGGSTLCVAMFGPAGIILYATIHCSLTSNGGNWLGADPLKEYPKYKCDEGFKDCELCGNGYSHAFNENYQNKLKWWQKIL